MASGRIVRKKISNSKQVNDLPDDTCRLLFTWLITHLDAQGCMYGEPEMVKSTVFPRRTDLTAEDIEKYLQALEESCDGDHPLIVRYKAKGERYLFAPAFTSQQGFRKDLGSGDYPLPPEEVREKFRRSDEPFLKGVKKVSEDISHPSKEVKEKSSCSTDKDRDRDRDKDKDKDKDNKGVAQIAKAMNFPMESWCLIVALAKNISNLTPKKTEQMFAELKAILSQLEDATRKDDYYADLFTHALDEAVKHKAKSVNYVRRIVESEIAKHEAEREDEEQKLRAEEARMRGDSEFTKLEAMP